MPHLMNCPHSEEGWCLDCVKELWDEHNGPDRTNIHTIEVQVEAPNDFNVGQVKQALWEMIRLGRSRMASATEDPKAVEYLKVNALCFQETRDIESLEDLIAEVEKYDTCMAISISNEGKSVDLILDTARSYYGEWITGEGGDICLYRDNKTNKVVGCHLPLMCNRLAVHHDGPIRINAGFKK